MSRILALAVALTLAAPVAAAQAGTYHVYTCVAAGKVWANGAWKTATAAGRRRRTRAAPGSAIALTRARGRADGRTTRPRR